MSIFSSVTHFSTYTHYLYVESMCRCEVAVLEQSMKVLGEDECVWTERVFAECRFPDVRYALNLAQTVTLQCLTHFFNTTNDKGKSVGSECWSFVLVFIFSYIYIKHC